MSTVLRYPGGKARAIKILDKYLPNDVKELCAPFAGGASFELYCAQKRGIRVYACDRFEPLVNFWSSLKHHPSELRDAIQQNHEALERMGT